VTQTSYTAKSQVGNTYMVCPQCIVYTFRSFGDVLYCTFAFSTMSSGCCVFCRNKRLFQCYKRFVYIQNFEFDLGRKCGFKTEIFLPLVKCKSKV
jgi:hypothetical protein